MLSRVLLLIAVLSLSFPLSAFAAVTVVVNNYFYVHENTAGTFSFNNKTGGTVQYGDGVQFDASIVSIDVIAQGMAVGDSITAHSSSGASYPVTPGQTTTVSVAANESLSITLTKSGTNEVYARLDVLRAFDQSDGGTDVNYNYSLNEIPSAYGDLGPGGSSQIVPGTHYYFQPRDAYKYDYTAPTGATRYELHFLDELGNTMYKRDYESAPSGIHYLTCNGTYEMQFFDGSGSVIAKSPHMETTEILSPTCDSFPGTGAGFQDFQVDKTSNGDGTANLDWDDVPGATKYEVYRNGEKIGEPTESNYPINDDGAAYTVVAKDSTNNVIGQTDLPATTTTPPAGGCNGCELLTEMLDCPGWDQYMGDLTQAIQNALPPPPDWDLIADKIGASTISHLSTYLGDVPAPPTDDDIGVNTYQPLPPVDISVPDSDQLTPTVPSDFNTPKPFNIEDGPQIDVTDNSQPFVLTDPLSGMQIDEPGTPVIPGDPRNSSGGIKTPDNVDTGGEAIPAMPSSEPPPVPSGNPEEVPPAEIPMPSVEPAEIPIPTDPGGDIPIPQIIQ